MRLASSLLIVFSIVFVVPATGIADDADEALPEREFIQQSIQRLKAVQRRADNYEDYVRTLRGAPSRNSRDGIVFDTGPTVTRMDRHGRMAGVGSRNNLERMEFDLRTLKRKAGQTLDDLGEMRRQTAEGEELDRDKIDATIKRLERDADEIERDLRRL